MLRRCCAALAPAQWRAVPEKVHYDVCIIGGGPAGIAAAFRAVDYKKTVCLIEKGPIGGADLWDGALQSKTMWECAMFLQKLRGQAGQRLFGGPVSDHVEIDEEHMRESMRHVSETREHQICQALAATNVKLLVGQATFQSDHEVQCHNHTEKRYQNVTADYFVIATGSSPREHPFVTADGVRIVTSNEIMRQPLPESLVIIGAGVKGCEFASIFSALGKTKVALVDKAPRIFSHEDADIVEQVERQLERDGVLIHHHSTLYDLQKWEEDAAEVAARHPATSSTRQGGVQYTIMDRTTHKLTSYNVERALLTIGRTPTYRNLGLEHTSLRTQDGMLMVDHVGLCKGSKHIFAVGDAATDMPLVMMGEAQAKRAVDFMYSSRRRDLLLNPKSLSSAMTSVAFLTKAVASVGLNESECRRQNIAYICCRYGFDLVSRAVAAANTDGFIKIIVSNDAEMRVLGVRAVGMNASTMVDLGSLAIDTRQTALDLADRLTAYPAVSQAFQECVHALLGRSELKPGTFGSMVITKWKPADYGRGSAYQAEVRAELAAKSAGTFCDDGETVCVVNRSPARRALTEEERSFAAAASTATVFVSAGAPSCPVPFPSGSSAVSTTAAAAAAAAAPAPAAQAATPFSSPSPASASSSAHGPADESPIQPGFFFKAHHPRM